MDQIIPDARPISAASVGCREQLKVYRCCFSSGKGFEYVMAEEVVYTPGQRCWNLDRAIVTSLDLCPLIQLNLLSSFHTSSQNMTGPRGCARATVKDARAHPVNVAD